MALLFNRPGAVFSLPLIICDWYYKYTPSFPITEKFLQPSSSGTSITAGQNNTLSDRSGTVTFTQSESGKQVSVSLNQSKGVEGWNYTFEVSPASLSFDAAGGTKQVSVTSYRCQTVNGIENGVQENVGYSSSVSGDGFSSAGTSISANENMDTSSRSGYVVFMQNNSGKSIQVSTSQAAGVITTEYYLEVIPEEIEFQNGIEGEAFSEITSELRTIVNGHAIIDRKTIDWTYTTYYQSTPEGDPEGSFDVYKLSTGMRFIYQGQDITWMDQGIRMGCEIAQKESGKKIVIDVQVIG